MVAVLGLHPALSAHIHDPSVALVIDGKLEFAIEEERLNRVKTSLGLFPERGIKAALNQSGLSLQDIDSIAIDGVTSKHLEAKVRRYLYSMFGYCPTIKKVSHPIAHGSGAFYASPFDEALVFSIDGEGDGVSVLIYLENRLGKRKVLYTSKFPASFGGFYTAFTNYLGFRSIEGEYKVMGMAAYGNPDAYDLKSIFNFNKQTGNLFFLDELRDTFANTSVFETHACYEKIQSLTHVEPVFSALPVNFTQQHFDLAASVQKTFEDAYLGIIDYYVALSGVKNVCISGGCALNCLANMKLMSDRDYHVYVQPAASDRGLSLGSAYEISKSLGDTPKPADHMFLGCSYTSSEIENALHNSGLPFYLESNISNFAANKISEGHVLAWFQGRSEFGPRALGGRSILASASVLSNKDKINEKIKFREMFRPFAPAILQEDMHYLTGLTCESPYMTSTFRIIESHKSSIQACCHEDNSARIQTVGFSQHPLYSILQHIKAKTGIGACVNTSFNLAGEPIVETPVDALRTFVSSGLDYLCIGSYVVSKTAS